MKYLVILFLFFVGNVYSQVIELRGRILNSTNKLPLPLANIIVKGKEIGTAADEKGNFLLKGNLIKDDLLRLSHIGYETIEISVAEFLSYTTKDILLNSKIITSQTVLVKGTIGKEGVTPISFSKVTREDFYNSYTYQDIPEVLSYLPSATFYSENGNGLGYNYLSIRGFDQRRISVAINGIPQNDPEDHNVYWLDFPDLLESTELIQVQRGAGSGITGYPAIGGSINIITSAFSDMPRFELSSSIGSFNTRKYSAAVSSGLIDNKYSVYAKLSQILSSGYRNSSWINFKSYHLSAVKYDESFTTQINLFGGPVSDGLAYTGIAKFAIKNKDLRKVNYSYWEEKNNQYTYTLNRRSDEIENFFQPHFELLNEYKLNDNVTLNSALFLVLGNGFFDYDGSWADTSYFRLTIKNGFRPKLNPGNAIIRAMVENKQWGWIPRFSLKHEKGELIVGGEVRMHKSVHWGSINYAENLPVGITKDYRYYYYEGGKNILSVYAHENYKLNDNFNFLAELQLTYHIYKIENEKYLDNKFSISGLYLNPRVGINYRYSPRINFYSSFARVTREPRLKNYYDAAESSGGAVPQFETTSSGVYDFTKPLVKPETMNDIEVGASYYDDILSASLNGFYMLFDNEIVKQGQVDRFGQPITGNMERTIHYGFETVINTKLNDNIELIINSSFSKNYISKGEKYVKYTDPLTKLKKVAKIDLSNNRINGFPDLTFNAIIKFQYENLLTQVSAKYVGDFYTDNYDNKLAEYRSLYPKITDYSDNTLDNYFTVNIFTSYDFIVNNYLKNVRLFAQVNNIFNKLYAAYGIGKEYFPAAERNFLFGIKVGI